MEMMMDRKKRGSSVASRGTSIGMSEMDAAYMSDPEIHPKKKLKKINHEKNKLLESFFASLSFMNLFKLLKFYHLKEMDSFGHGFHHGIDIDIDMNEEVDDSEDE